MSRLSDIAVILLTLAVASLASCSGSDSSPVFSRFEQVPGAVVHRGQWFDFDTRTDTNAGFSPSARYDVDIIVRTTARFDHRLLWIATETPRPDLSFESDTIPLEICSPTGRRTGAGSRGLYTSRTRLHSGIALPDGFVISLSHAMRENDVPGVADIGIVITPTAN